MPIRIGVIGAGPNAAGHAKYYAASPRTTLVAVADPDLARAGALATETGSKAVADFRSFLNDVDAVVVSSPNFLHLEHAEAVCAAGKHLYCEKPMGLSLADADRIVAAVDKAKVKSQVGFATRLGGTTRALARRAQAGEFGRLVGVTSRRLMMFDRSKLTGWRVDPDKSGGLLMEINIHELDWMMQVAGPVTSVSARTWAANPGHPRANDRVWVSLGFANGAVGTHEGGWLSPTAQFFRAVEGDAGGGQTNEWGSVLFVAGADGKRVETPADAEFDLRGNFLDAIEGKAAADADVHWARQVMAVGEAVFASAAKDGAAVAVSTKAGMASC